MTTIKDQFEKNGYAVIENFLSDDDILKLKTTGKNFVNSATQISNKSVFSTISKSHLSDRYFIESADKISFFYEADALNEDGTFKVDPEISLNKVGHALHWLDPECKRITFSEKVKNICRVLDIKNPVVVQSMYIYKNPFIGGEVKEHQDASYLYSEPVKLVGFWFALDDATEENGCLSFVPGSHKCEVGFRSIRNRDKNSKNMCINIGSYPKFQDFEFKLVPVKKGTCIILHGKVFHRSSKNTSNRSRHVYTFHVFDNFESIYSPDNWIQANFQSLYSN